MPARPGSGKTAAMEKARWGLVDAYVNPDHLLSSEKTTDELAFHQ